jgi:molecular chaperone Hsp33
MADRVAGLEPIATMLEGRGRTARELVATVFEGFDHQELASSELRFGCTCSEVRVMSSLLSLGDAEVAALIAGDPLEVRCDACGQTYVIDPVVLRGYRDSRNTEPS